MEKRIGREIKNVHILTTQYIMQNIKSNEQNILSPVQIDIMEYLAEATEEVYQKELEKEFRLRKSTISGILQTMEKNGMIRKFESKGDFRSKRIELTKKGKDIFNNTINKIMNMENLLEKDIKKKELKTFFKVVDQIKRNLENYNHKN